MWTGSRTLWFCLYPWTVVAAIAIMVAPAAYPFALLPIVMALLMEYGLLKNVYTTRMPGYNVSIINEKNTGGTVK